MFVFLGWLLSWGAAWLWHRDGLTLPWDLALILLLTWQCGRRWGWIALAIYMGAMWSLNSAGTDALALVSLLISYGTTGAGLIFLVDEFHSRWRRAEESSRRDPLTGISNRRALEEALTAELARQLRHGRAFTLVLWDCDGFKALNDQRGHQTGDAALVALAECLRSHVRSYDTVARLGGDEFVLLLVEADLLDIEPILERLRTEIRFVIERLFPPLTVTAGVVVFRQPPADSAASLALVDQAMYRAKRRGLGETEFEVYEGLATHVLPFPTSPGSAEPA